MNKIALDPTLVSTPIGAAIGLALVRTLFTEKDRTLGKYLVGGGLGAGAGYVAGELYKANKPLEVTGKPAADWRSALSFAGKEPKEEITEDERTLAASLYRAGIGIPKEDGLQKRMALGLRDKYREAWSNAAVYRMRANANRLKSEQTGITDIDKKRFLDLAKQNEEKAKQEVKLGTPGILNKLWAVVKGGSV